MTLRRQVGFSAAHAYWLPEKSEAENKALFGPWASKWGHGHNYLVEACVTGEVDERTGMVINIVALDAALKKEVLEPLADRHLNYETDHFARVPPTLENIARFVAGRLGAHFTGPEALLTRVRVWEMPTLWASWERENEMLQLTRRIDFAASHRLHAPALSQAENEAIFGKCNNPMGHGHNYVVEVSVAGTPDPNTGMLVDLEKLDAVLEAEVMARFDHKNLNADVAELAGINPTSENLTLAIWKVLEKKIPAPARLVRVVVKETDRNYFEYCGESAS